MHGNFKQRKPSTETEQVETETIVSEKCFNEIHVCTGLLELPDTLLRAQVKHIRSSIDSHYLPICKLILPVLYLAKRIHDYGNNGIGSTAVISFQTHEQFIRTMAEKVLKQIIKVRIVYK